MQELDGDTLAAYLRKQGWFPGGLVSVESLAWGVSNAVFRVRAGDQLLVVKQARGQLRTKEAWFSDLGRVFREVAAMRLLKPLLPPGTVPAILGEDREAYLFAMSHAPLDAAVWKEQLLHGTVDQRVARQAGRVLGLLHERTAPLHDEPASDGIDLGDKAVFVQLRVDPFYRRVRERQPEVADAMDDLIDQAMGRREALCHADFSPKNLLVGRDSLTLVDYETAHWGDPTFDLGFLLSHLMLKGVRAAPGHAAFRELTNGFWHAYLAEARVQPATDLISRGIQHCAGCALARIDGTSPVDYLPDEPRREAVRAICRGILLDRPATWADVWSIIGNQLRSLPDGAVSA